MSIERGPVVGLDPAPLPAQTPAPTTFFPGPLSGPEWAVPSDPVGAAPRRQRGWGVMSVMLVLAAVALEVGGILTSISQEYTIGIVLALLSIVASVAAVVVGVVALVLGRGRRWGVAGVVLGVLANPLLQNWLLSAAS